MLVQARQSPSHPGTQTHAALPANELEFTGHARHSSFERSLLYVPAAHWMQEPAKPTLMGHRHAPCASGSPCRHVHAVASPLPGGEVRSDGHWRHTADEVAPSAVE